MQIERYFQTMAEHRASDLFFSTGSPVGIKIEGITRYLNKQALKSEETRALAYSVMSEAQRALFERELEMSLSVPIEGLGRFRCTIYRQRSTVAMAVRHVRGEIPKLDELHLPPILKELIMEPRGLILVVGATGSGKSTTLASMIDERNCHKSGHILTIEDPIEYLHQHQRAIVDQRELGLDSLSYNNALRNAMRAAPDVILIGEIRDRDTMQHAITYAETGHLCLSTLHANNAYQTIDRIINFFPDTAHRQLLTDLSMNLRAVVSQRLVMGMDGLRLPATEIMLDTPYVKDLIEKGKIATLREAIEDEGEERMHTFDQCLFKLYDSGKISRDEALHNAGSRGDLELRINTESSRG